MPTASLGPNEPTSAPAPPPSPVRIWTVFAGFGAALFVGLLLQIACFVWLAWRELERPGHTCDSLINCVDLISRHPSDLGTALTLALMAGTWTAFSFLGAILGPAPVTERLALRPCKNAVATGTALLLGMLSIAYGGIALTRLNGAAPGPVLKLLSGMVGNASPHGLGLVVWVGLGVGGVSEELLFRGFMQTRLQQRWGGWGIVVAAAAFGAMHWDFVHSPITFAEGLLLGVVARRSRSILPGAGAHAAQNLATIAISPWILQAGSGSRGYVILALALGGLAASWLALARLQPPER
jgi:membrane protease YdiL (CAAX protease family)